MSAPDEVTIEGHRYRRIDLHPNRVSVHVMYYCHLFRQLKGTSVEALIEDWQQECMKPDPNYGPPFLCPAIVLEGDKELRRVGSMVFPDSADTAKKLESWRDLVTRDPDIQRLLANAQCIHIPDGSVVVSGELFDVACAAIKERDRLLAEIERLNLKCGALAYLQYGSSGPDDPWQAKLDEVTKPLHADISQAYYLRDKAEGRYCTALGTIEQLHAALKTAQELAATRLMEIGRLQRMLWPHGIPHEPSELRPPVKLEDYGPVIDEVAPVTKEAWDALKSPGASRDSSSGEKS